MTGRMIGNSNSGRNVFIDKGIAINGTVDYQKVIRTVPAGMPWVPIVDSGDWAKLVPLWPMAVVASASTTAITVDSATQANYFDPADEEVNDFWLSANSGDQKVTYFDASATSTLAAGVSGLGLIYTEEKAVASVSSAVITLGAAFSADPAADDVILPGGIDEQSIIYEHAVILYDEINVDEINRYGAEFNSARAYGMNAVLKYDYLPYEFKQLITAGVIPANGCRNFRIERD